MISKWQLVFLSFIITFIFVFILGSFFIGRAAISKNSFSNTELAIETLASNKKVSEVYLHIAQNQTCYWIKYTDNQSNYLIQMNVYDNPEHDCMGVLKERKYIIIDRPVNIQGNICVCYNDDYVLDFTNIGNTSLLQISEFEPASPIGTISLGAAKVVKTITGLT